MSFHGSYRPQDVEFLLKPVTIEMVDDLADKERFIQAGLFHYSEMLTPEKLPTQKYLDLFYQAYELNKERMSRDCLILVKLILDQDKGVPTLVSLARAGTPIGAIIAHIFRNIWGIEVSHYSISIIRDRGIDTVALDHIINMGHRPESIVFVDGWTGKGVISRELEMAVIAYNRERKVKINPGLFVLSDLAGTAAHAASGEDYLIPSSILNSTISGLVSRSILNKATGPSDFHGCVYFEDFTSNDLSCWFVDEIVTNSMRIYEKEGLPVQNSADREALAEVSRHFLVEEMKRHGISDKNLVKPGIGEATRVLLRRLPYKVIVRDQSEICVAHLISLAQEKQVPIEERPDLPYHAVSIIRSLCNA